MRTKEGRILIGRLPHGADLLGSLTSVCMEEKVRFGTIAAIGAVSSARLGYYKQDELEYMDCLNVEKGLEIVSCQGNVSLKDGEVFVHVHATLSDDKGRCFGGHLMEGTRIYAAEFHVMELSGEPLAREFDSYTGLYLWPMK